MWRYIGLCGLLESETCPELYVARKVSLRPVQMLHLRPQAEPGEIYPVQGIYRLACSPIRKFLVRPRSNFWKVWFLKLSSVYRISRNVSTLEPIEAHPIKTNSSHYNYKKIISSYDIQPWSLIGKTNYRKNPAARLFSTSSAQILMLIVRQKGA